MRQTVTYEEFLGELGRWMADESEEKDIRPLRKMAFGTLNSRTPISQLAAPLAVVWFSIMDFDTNIIRDSISRILLRGWTLLLRWVFRGRPLWNDFYMGLWMLSRDAFYVERLYDHLKRGSAEQKGTGEWMVNSVCKQDGEFAGHWTRIEAERGPIFEGDLMRMIWEGPCSNSR